MAITHSLPLGEWYLDETSEWTLDYPPLFAWFEWCLSQVAVYIDTQMVRLASLNYASNACIIFQRFSVMVSELVLVSAVAYACRGASEEKRMLMYLLVLGSPGLLLVDHIHFQYNGMLLGLLLWSIIWIQEGRHMAGSIAFAVLVNMKHLYACLAPVYLIYLLRHYCRGPNAVQRFVVLGAAVVAVCGASFGPFIVAGQLPQILGRLFPFGRGLCHAYWAANFWALYSCADKALAVVLPRLGLPVTAPEAYMTGGLVQVTQFAILPSPSPSITLLLVLLALLPCLFSLWQHPRPESFLPAAVYACLCSFVFGYHVHEKAILMVTIPMALAVAESQWNARQYFVMSTVGHVALMPLLFTEQEYPIKALMVLLHTAVAYWMLCRVVNTKASALLSKQQQAYLIHVKHGFV
ncbi:hypothetical protein WJX77_004608 [Trebouxia sp. C0004]